MLLILGFIIVIAATLGGFMLAGGHPVVLLHVSEFVVIGGIGLGILIVACPLRTLISLSRQVRVAISGSSVKKQDYSDMLKMIYELFILARRNGLIALEDHVIDPLNSPLFKNYPSFLNNPKRVAFLCNGLKPIIDGRVKPEQLEGMFNAEVGAMEEEADAPVVVLQLVGDSLPGVGIIACVLGVINTMAVIADGPDKVGRSIAAALTGTFLGVLGAYGFVNPLTGRIKGNNIIELQYFKSMTKGVSGFANGMAPMMAVEVARRCLDSSVQVGSDELEQMLKTPSAPARS